MTDISDTGLMAFKCITNFVNDIASFFGKKQKSLRLYERLINKTLFTHEKAMKKHIDTFQKWCVLNREAISNDDYTKVHGNIVYSDNVYINIKAVFNMADKETAQIIWKHILCISGLLDPASNAKNILKQKKEVKEEGTGQETEFLNTIINKVTSNVNPNANPMEAVSSILQSGIFTDLLGGLQTNMQSGQLDLGKLLGAVQGMVSSLQTQVDDNDVESKNAVQMINNLTGMVGKMGMGSIPTSNTEVQTMLNSMSGGMQVREVKENEEGQDNENSGEKSENNEKNKNVE